MICVNGGLCTGCMRCIDGKYYDPTVDQEPDGPEEQDWQEG